MTTSKQPRVTKDQAYYFFRDLQKCVNDLNVEAPAYLPNSTIRDRWLVEFSKKEPFLKGVLKSVVDIDKNRGWELVGGRNQVKTFSQILRNAEPTEFDVFSGLPINGLGWRYYFSQQSQAYYTTDIGAISEVGRDIEGGRLNALWSVDSTKCYLTGKKDTPLAYTPLPGTPQYWDRNDYIRETSMPSIDEAYNGLGYCAVSRVYDLARIMVAIYEHTLEKLLAKVPKGILLMQGVNEEQWEETLETHSERLTAQERQYYAGLSIFFGDESMDAKLMALSQLPDGFELETITNLMMFAYATAFGYDAREFWPVGGGSLGTGRETEVQAIKASGKGGLDFILAYQDNLQRLLPGSLLWQFEQRNEQGELVEAEVAQKWAEAINELAKPSGTGLPPTLSNEEKRQLQARLGLIPEDWTIQEEASIATDTDSGEVDRWLDMPQVRRAIDVFPGEEIVRFTYPDMKQKVVFNPLAIRPTHHILGKIRGISRTRDDYERRIKNLAYSLRRGDIDEFEFVDSMTTTIRQNFRQAWLDGAKKIGFREGELEPEDYEPLETITNNEFLFLPGFSEFIVSMREEPASALDYRIAQWANRYSEVSDTSMAHFGKNKKLLWEYDPSKENCQDCANLNGQVRRAKFWNEKGIHPLSMQLQCGPGRRCGCRFVETDLPVSRGRLPRIVGP